MAADRQLRSVLIDAPPAGYRVFERRVRIGSGEARWEFATRETLNWGIKNRSGFTVEPQSTGVRGPLSVTVGDTLHLVLGVGPFRLREPVRVLRLINEPDRQGFAYGTLPGHQLVGEEQFVVEKDGDGIVWLTVRTVSRPAPGWVWARPLLALGQRLVRARYLKALSGPLS